ncbi:MAG: hypothetical protein A4E53_01536 [Pelotomaculum sp. PtaB.Bin104]|nr:MAG: hypothetical protein A4E53_01536 [Pelotomaculum sp. PtaB.Bin104]
MSYKEFFTAEKIQELLDCIRQAGNRKKGFVDFSSKYGLSASGVNTYFYNHLVTPELDRELPRGGNEPANKKKNNKQVGGNNPISVEQALNELGKTELTKEDIEDVARKTGVHYHDALSIWGAMRARDRELCSPEEDSCTGSLVCRWLFAELFASLVDSGVTVAKIAERYRVSQAFVRETVKTYRAFPEKEDRKYGLEFTYYRLAAGTNDSHGWMQKTKENGWSVRELKAAIDGKPVETAASLRRENESLMSQLNEYQSRLAEKEKQLTGIVAELDRLKFKSAAASVITEDKVVPGDIDRAIERTGLNAKKVEDAIWKIFNLPEYAVWRETLCSLKREIRLLRLKKETGDCAYKSRTDDAAVVITRKQAECLPTVGHLLGLYERIAAQEEKIRALCKLNLVYLMALKKKNTKLRYLQEIVKLPTSQNVYQEGRNAQVN